MSFSFIADESGRSRIVVGGEPDYIVSLPIAPLSLEDIVKRGKWICVGISVWSIHDINAGVQAITRIKSMGGSVKLGLRPVNLPEENCKWIPNLHFGGAADQTRVAVTEEDGSLEITISGNSQSSPVWVTFSEGIVVSLRYGQLEDVEIDDLITEVLSFSS